MTINVFGTLMQTTLPLFTVSLNITDKKFSEVTSLIAKAGVGLVATGGAGVWYGTCRTSGRGGRFHSSIRCRC
jgi:hypothetical protein